MMHDKDKTNHLTRRQFIGATAAAGLGLTLSSCATSNQPFDPKGLSTRQLGQMGIQVPLLSYGLGNRWMMQDEQTGLDALLHAYENGVFYWDTAPTYNFEKKYYSEERIGQVLPERRQNVFLVTKIRDRDPDAAKKTIETSLKRLNTDYIDLLHVHSIQSVKDAESIGRPGQILDLLKHYKSEGIVKHIGFTGHRSAKAMKRVIELNDLEAMMIAMNHADHLSWGNIQDANFEELAVPFAAQKNMGLIAMKVIRPRETVQGLTVDNLVRYALSYNEFATAVISMQTKNEVDENLSIIRNFEPLEAETMNELRATLEPFYQGKHLDWMHFRYVDGLSGNRRRFA